MRILASIALCSLSMFAGCKSWSWSPNEWFAASAPPPQANTSATIAAPALAPDASGLAETGPGQTMQLGRPISAVQPGVSQPGSVQPARPAVHAPRYLPYAPPGQAAPATPGGATFRVPSRDSVTMDVPPTERTAVATTVAQPSPRVASDAADAATGNSHTVTKAVAADVTPPQHDERPMQDADPSSPKSAWNGWQAAKPVQTAEANDDQDPQPAKESASQPLPAASAPRTGAEVTEKAAAPPAVNDTDKPEAAKTDAANKDSSRPPALPQQPITIQHRPL